MLIVKLQWLVSYRLILWDYTIGWYLDLVRTQVFTKTLAVSHCVLLLPAFGEVFIIWSVSCSARPVAWHLMVYLAVSLYDSYSHLYLKRPCNGMKA